MATNRKGAAEPNKSRDEQTPEPKSSAGGKLTASEALHCIEEKYEALWTGQNQHKNEMGRRNADVQDQFDALSEEFTAQENTATVVRKTQTQSQKDSRRDAANALAPY